ncbi:MAG: 3'-5' exonuclease, partial [Robiginitomaculum sp.]|nr:3'-5' exonuclease [Robiginitomaculum sp.]
MIWIAVITLFAALAFWFLNRSTVEPPGAISDDMELSDFVRENDDWVVLDTETTRLGPKAEVLEISIVDKTGKVLLDTLVKPKGSISAESKAVHGIDRKMVADAPTWPQIAAKFEDIVSDRAVFAYNAKFDFGVIEQTYDRWNLQPAAVQNVQGLCAMLAYADHRGGTKWHKLKDACDHEGVDFPEQHRAL